MLKIRDTEDNLPRKEQEQPAPEPPKPKPSPKPSGPSSGGGKRVMGIRYSERGVRMLILEKSGPKVVVTGLAAGALDTSAKMLFGNDGFTDAAAVINVGLAPGRFLSSSLYKENGMSIRDMEDHLNWEIKEKIISGQDDYRFSFVSKKNVGFAFAGKSDILDTVTSEFKATHGFRGSIIVDVEPVALYNSLEQVMGVPKDNVMAVGVEAEGISSLVFENGDLMAMDSAPAFTDNADTMTAGLDMGAITDSEALSSQLAENIQAAVNREIVLGETRRKPQPEKLVLTGSGVYIEGLPSRVEELTGLPCEVLEPFTSVETDIRSGEGARVDQGAAFTVCYGLALRALEE